jgi:uncharacterized protein (DUF2235 family)
MGKNIVICCDGTENEVAGNPTNVLRLFRILVRNESKQSFMTLASARRPTPQPFGL